MYNEKIRELRKSYGITLKQITTYLGISIQAYQKYENGKGYPTIENLIKIASLYGVSIDYILDYQIDKNKATELLEEVRHIKAANKEM